MQILPRLSDPDSATIKVPGKKLILPKKLIDRQERSEKVPALVAKRKSNKSNDLKIAINVSKKYPPPTLRRSSISLITPIEVAVVPNIEEEELKSELDKKDELAVYQKAKLPLP